MEFIKNNKFRIIYFGLAALAVATMFIGLFGTTMQDSVRAYNVFGMLDAYGVKGEHQGFISLMTPIVIFFTIICYAPPVVLWIIGGIKNRRAPMLYGLPLTAAVLQIVWFILFANYLNISGWDVFFDMSRSDVVGGAYVAVVILNIVLLVASMVLRFTLCKKEQAA